jgi:hypothetical protein
MEVGTGAVVEGGVVPNVVGQDTTGRFTVAVVVVGPPAVVGGAVVVAGAAVDEVVVARLVTLAGVELQAARVRTTAPLSSTAATWHGPSLRLPPLTTLDLPAAAYRRPSTRLRGR